MNWGSIVIGEKDANFDGIPVDAVDNGQQTPYSCFDSLETRVYYGELYTDDARYMAKQSPYYDAITTLLTNRMKYVSGDQSMKVDSFGGKEILYSVRYGKDIMSADQIRGVETIKHSGLLTLITNDSNF